MAAEESRPLPEDDHGFPFRSGNTKYESEEESTLASQQYSERMLSQTELMESLCDTSGLSTSSFSLYTPDSDLDLFDRSFSTHLVQPDSDSSTYDEKRPHSFHDRPLLPSSSAWISESKDFVDTFPETSMEAQSMWESQTDICSANARPLPFENFKISSPTPLLTPSKTTVVRGYGQPINTAEARCSTHHRRPNTRPHSTSSERRSSSLGLRVADAPRPSLNLNHPKSNLKRTHNMVEKQYRNRLNGHFASLLAKIPDELAATTGFDTSGGAKNISKADTLVLAQRYIKMLQVEETELQKKNKRLEEDFDRLKKAWIVSGGVLIP